MKSEFRVNKIENGLARQSVEAIVWKSGSHIIQIVILFFGSVILANLLTPEVFGTYTLVKSIVTFTQSIPAFGLGTAYINRSRESNHVDAIGVHFTLTLIFTSVWAFLLVGASFIFRGRVDPILSALVLTTFVFQSTASARGEMIKRLSFQRPAVVEMSQALLGVMIAIHLARIGGGIWSLLSIDIVTAIVSVIGYYLIKPVWKPRIAWSRSIVRYYLSFGWRVVWAGVLNQALDKLDEIWTGLFLGDRLLGFYSRAYTFANYPRKALITPIFQITVGLYAKVKDDWIKLSNVFVVVNSLVVQGSFLISGSLIIIAPEFVTLALGEAWLPMLEVFQIMIVYIMLDPIRITVGNMFPAIGEPGELVKPRFIQLGVLVMCLPLLGSIFGIKGVAMSANIMVLAGTVMNLINAKKKVDYSLVDLFAIPFIAITLGLIITFTIINWFGDPGLSWRSGIVKLAIFIPLYLGMLLGFKWKLYRGILKMIRQKA